MMDNERVVESMDFRLNEIGNYWTWNYISREVTDDWAGKGVHLLVISRSSKCPWAWVTEAGWIKKIPFEVKKSRVLTSCLLKPYILKCIDPYFTENYMIMSKTSLLQL